MTTSHDTGPTPDEVAALEAWAEAGDFEGIPAGHALRGQDARAAGRALLEAVGVDLAALDRGHPRQADIA